MTNDSAEQDTEAMVTIPVRFVRYAQMSDRTFRVLAVVMSHIQHGEKVTIDIDTIAAQAGLSAKAFEASMEAMTGGGNVLHPVFDQEEPGGGRLTITYPPDEDDPINELLGPRNESETVTVDLDVDLRFGGPL